MKQQLLRRIRHEASVARSGGRGRIVAKCNAITDHDMIDALYQASRAGVEVRLLVRGICCLLPGVPGLSDRIEVRSVVGRFLEHDRIYWFENGSDAGPAVYIGSADWMDRNLERRVEVLVPLLDADLVEFMRELLEAYLNDTRRTRLMLADGSYLRMATDDDAFDVHQHLMAKR
jgi:polyphosphate kinase